MNNNEWYEKITRGQVTKDILYLSNNNILAELPISMGKAKIALEWLKKYHKENTPILITVPTFLIIQLWASSTIPQQKPTNKTHQQTQALNPTNKRYL